MFKFFDKWVYINLYTFPTLWEEFRKFEQIMRPQKITPKVAALARELIQIDAPKGFSELSGHGKAAAKKKALFNALKTMGNADKKALGSLVGQTFTHGVRQNLIDISGGKPVRNSADKISKRPAGQSRSYKVSTSGGPSAPYKPVEGKVVIGGSATYKMLMHELKGNKSIDESAHKSFVSDVMSNLKKSSNRTPKRITFHLDTQTECCVKHDNRDGFSFFIQPANTPLSQEYLDFKGGAQPLAVGAEMRPFLKS